MSVAATAVRRTVVRPTLPTRDVFGRSWKGRRVTAVGLGRSGQAAAVLLHRAGCRVRMTDHRSTPELREAADRLLAGGVDAVELGGHTRGSLAGAELVVVSPGVPDASAPLQWAAQDGIPVMGEIDLAFHFCQAPVIAVTGTNGKSTAVTLIAAVLAAAGRSAVACGNLGVPFSSVIDRLSPSSVAVVEVSSFQLLACEAFRPHIGVLLNLGTNHLDRHRDPAAYLAAKARVFQRQDASDWAVLNAADGRIAALARQLRAQVAWFGGGKGHPPALRLAPETLRALTPGLQAVLQVARLAGVADPLAWQAMRAFRGLEHRLEPVATVRGVAYVNDSKSTTPDSLVYALQRTRGPVVLIMGGRDKGMDFSQLAAPLHEPRVQGIVLIGEARARLRPMLNGSTLVRESATLSGAMAEAARLAAPGTTVLFSPGCASFDMFRDFEERGRAFKALVRAETARQG